MLLLLEIKIAIKPGSYRFYYSYAVMSITQIYMRTCEYIRVATSIAFSKSMMFPYSVLMFFAIRGAGTPGHVE